VACDETRRQWRIDRGYEFSYPRVVDAHPDGPRVVGSRNQVTLPPDQMKAIGVAPGDPVWIALNPDRPGTLVILSREGIEDIFRKGWVAL
jgi:hypothetical protein